MQWYHQQQRSGSPARIIIASEQLLRKLTLMIQPLLEVQSLQPFRQSFHLHLACRVSLSLSVSYFYFVSSTVLFRFSTDVFVWVITCLCCNNLNRVSRTFGDCGDRVVPGSLPLPPPTFWASNKLCRKILACLTNSTGSVELISLLLTNFQHYCLASSVLY